MCGVTGAITSPAREGENDAGPQSPPMHMQVDWDLGVSGHSDHPIEDPQVQCGHILKAATYVHKTQLLATHVHKINCMGHVYTRPIAWDMCTQEHLLGTVFAAGAAGARKAGGRMGRGEFGRHGREGGG